MGLERGACLANTNCQTPCYPLGGRAVASSVQCWRNARERVRQCPTPDLPCQKYCVIGKPPVGDISVITLIRTDTTLDHSQKAEKVYLEFAVSPPCHNVNTRGITTCHNNGQAGHTAWLYTALVPALATRDAGGGGGGGLRVAGQLAKSNRLADELGGRDQGRSGRTPDKHPGSRSHMCWACRITHMNACHCVTQD